MLTKSQVNRLRQYAVRGELRLHRLSNDDVVLIELCYLKHTGTGKTYSITDLGREELSRRARRFRAHNSLAQEFGIWLEQKNRVVWSNIELKGTNGKVIRPDLFSLHKTYNPERLDPRIHEVKVTRSDFLTGMRSIQKYTGLYSYLFFITSEGVCSKSEIPDPYGLYQKVESNFVLVKRANQCKCETEGFGLSNWMRLILKLE